MFAIQIGFLSFSLLDVLDILITGYIMFRVYKLLKGSIALNIFFGLISFLVVSWVFRQLEVHLLTQIFSALSQVGVIALVIVFQPEVRKFLLWIGRETIGGRGFMHNLFMNRALVGATEDKKRQIQEILKCMEHLAKDKTGALIILATENKPEGIENVGVTMNAEISALLLESIFNKTSPIHDGAVIISDGKICSASAVLPISDNQDLPKTVGLRHRSALGITEKSHECIALIVSEETGHISYAQNGELHRNLTIERLENILAENL